MSISGISGPPEMMGTPEPFTGPSPADTAFWDALKGVGKSYTDEDVQRLDKFINDYPNYGAARYWRANIVACEVKPSNLARAKSDLQVGISVKDDTVSMSERKEMLSLLAKIVASEGDSSGALDLLEQAMRLDLSVSNDIFNTQGVVPERTSGFCTWNLTDINALIAAAPKDWRPRVLLGSYYEFFTTFNESYYSQAEASFQKALMVDGRTPVVPYLQGELKVHSAFWTKKAWASDAARNEIYRASIPLFAKAILLDPNFEQAYAARAEAYLELKQDTLAVKDFDKVLSLKPDDYTALADRGMAQSDLGKYYLAITDFGDAIRAHPKGDIYVPTLYSNRADAYVKVRDYRRAIDDYSSAIELKLENQVILLSLAQFRGLYPEYASVSDDVLVQKLKLRFAPSWETVAFKKQLQGNGKYSITFLLSDLYEARGDTYLKSGDYRRGILDFQLIYGGFPERVDSTERWRAIGTFGHGDNYYLDVKSSDVLTESSPRIWVKRMGAKQSEVMALELNCQSRRLRQDSSISYDSNNNTIGQSEGSGWSDVTPDTLGEQLWDGVCKSKP
ncbi:tetratricopeptide repeat protein [Granulicella mallensis]|uniref:Tetratricopeptide TPR_1 repeat-containing protein n=1 Tax=Granulicella mallensis (strain ATCC BAA-1857 / DSM 23137 / MP5ACTX8) TaxID=682795 RepID=G8NZ57_GRAMM|nr:surface-adhesin E family protein [Granulicella mallensis]AEU36793.1 Tetratricopeptide TPR_1 repeat-containing protein [Granulicella mallensis MP5ACTX8]